MDARPATAADFPAVVRATALAFLQDPVWSWVFPDDARRYEMLVPVWEMFIGSSLRQGGVWMTDGAETATVWVPPGGAELSPAEEEQLGELLEQLLPERHGEVDELLARFAENHPHEPHHYLSIFGTHPDQRGRGIGMALLARDLDRIDAEHMPAYLESTNAANNPRYESAGFRPVGAFSSPGGEVTVTTMWREAR